MGISLLSELRELGIRLSINGGRLAYDAPSTAINDGLLARMRSQRDELIAAILEQQSNAKQYLTPITGVMCPWCRSPSHLQESSDGIDCHRCHRAAFRFEGESIVRCDWNGR